MCGVCNKNEAIFKRLDRYESGKRIRYYGYGPCSAECTSKLRSKSISTTLLDKDESYYKNRANSAVDNYIESSNHKSFFINLKERYGKVTLQQLKWHDENSIYGLQFCSCGNLKRWKKNKYVSCSASCSYKKSGATRRKMIASGKIKMPERKPTTGNTIKKKKLTLPESLKITANKKLVNSIKKLDGYTYVSNDGGDNYDIIHNSCKRIFTIDRQLLTSRMWRGHTLCTKCNSRYSGISSAEMELSDFIKSMHAGNILLNDRSIIPPYEIDIFLPDINLALEYNGLYWHGEDKVGKNTHRDKTNLCTDKSIRLIHIWEHHWLNKQDIVKSIIKSAIGKSGKTYARKCEIGEPTKDEIYEFLERNHLQGKLWYTKALGLYQNNELVQVMTLNKYSKYWEIGRLSTKLDYIVVGGAERLFKHLCIDISGKIITYSDASIFTGNIYRKLGFDYIGLTEPGYFYHKNGEILSRQQCQKHKLVAMGYDPDKTERQIMTKRGYSRIYNCGNHKFEMNI